MYSTNVYYYIPRQIVVLNVGNSPRRYNTVYAKPLTLHKGVDNVIQFQIINQDQRPVDITGKDIIFRFLNYNGTEVLVKKLLNNTLPMTGITQLELGAADVEDFDAQEGFYSLEIPVNDFDMPVFVDATSGARGKMSLVNSVLPAFVPSISVTIPGHTTPNLGDPPVTYYSSQINTMDNSILTVQQKFTGFTGTMNLEGSTTGVDWYDITEATEYDNITVTEGLTITGFHPYIRIKYVSTSGTVDNILVR